MRFWHQGHWGGAGGADPALLWRCDRSPGWISGAAGVAVQSLPAPGTSSLRPLPPQQDGAVRPRAGRAPAAPGRSHRGGGWGHVVATSASAWASGGCTAPIGTGDTGGGGAHPHTPLARISPSGSNCCS